MASNHNLAGDKEGGGIRGRLVDAVRDAQAMDSSLSLCVGLAEKLDVVSGTTSRISALAEDDTPSDRSAAGTRAAASRQQDSKSSMQAVIQDLQRISARMGSEVGRAQAVVGTAKQSMQDAMRLLESVFEARRLRAQGGCTAPHRTQNPVAHPIQLLDSPQRRNSERDVVLWADIIRSLLSQSCGKIAIRSQGKRSKQKRRRGKREEVAEFLSSNGDDEETWEPPGRFAFRFADNASTVLEAVAQIEGYAGVQRRNRRFFKMGIDDDDAEAVAMLTRGGMDELHDEHRLLKNGRLSAQGGGRLLSGPALDAGIAKLTSLTSLDLSSNPGLQTLPLKALARMPQLERLELKGCEALWSVPEEIKERGGEAVMTYVREVAATGTENEEMSLFLVGNGEAGKTSLLRALVHGTAQEIDVDRRTVGIDIVRWDTQHGPKMRVFDLGGQRVYKTTHQFFLASRGFYCLVWRPHEEVAVSAKGEDEEAGRGGGGAGEKSANGKRRRRPWRKRMGKRRELLEGKEREDASKGEDEGERGGSGAEERGGAANAEGRGGAGLVEGVFGFTEEVAGQHASILGQWRRSWARKHGDGARDSALQRGRPSADARGASRRPEEVEGAAASGAPRGSAGGGQQGGRDCFALATRFEELATAGWQSAAAAVEVVEEWRRRRVPDPGGAKFQYLVVPPWLLRGFRSGVERRMPELSVETCPVVLPALEAQQDCAVAARLIPRGLRVRAAPGWGGKPRGAERGRAQEKAAGCRGGEGARVGEAQTGQERRQKPPEVRLRGGERGEGAPGAHDNAETVGNGATQSGGAEQHVKGKSRTKGRGKDEHKGTRMPLPVHTRRRSPESAAWAVYAAASRRSSGRDKDDGSQTAEEAEMQVSVRVAATRWAGFKRRLERRLPEFEVLADGAAGGGVGGEQPLQGVCVRPRNVFQLAERLRSLGWRSARKAVAAAAEWLRRHAAEACSELQFLLVPKARAARVTEGVRRAVSWVCVDREVPTDLEAAWPPWMRAKAQGGLVAMRVARRGQTAMYSGRGLWGRHAPATRQAAEPAAAEVKEPRLDAQGRVGGKDRGDSGAGGNAEGGGKGAPRGGGRHLGGRGEPAGTEAQLRAMIEGWVDMLQLRVPGARVALVVTHVDCVSPEALEQQARAVQEIVRRRLARYSKAERQLQVLNGGDSFRVNPREGAGVAAFRDALIASVCEMRGYRELLPAGWMRLQAALHRESASRAFLTVREFVKTAKACGTSELRSATMFLHDTAKIRFFGDMDVLEDATSSASDDDEQEESEELHGEEAPVDEKRLHKAIARATSPEVLLDVLSKALKKREMAELEEDARRVLAQMEVVGPELLEMNAGQLTAEGLGAEAATNIMELVAEANGSRFSGREDEEEVVYISPHWMVSVFKGVIRHEHGAMLRHLHRVCDLDNQRRARRLCVYGELHRDLLPYMWPTSGAREWPTSGEYWAAVQAGAGGEEFAYEREIWADVWEPGAGEGEGGGEGGSVIGSRRELRAALRLLQHFKVVSEAHGAEMLVPHKIAPSRRSVVDARALRDDQCPHQVKFELAALPDGLLGAVFLTLRESAFHADMSQHSAAFYNMGAVVQVFGSETAADAAITVRASSGTQLEAARSVVEKSLSFYPGLPWEVEADDGGSAADDVTQVQVVVAHECLRPVPRSDDGEAESKDGTEWSRAEFLALPEGEVVGECRDVVRFILERMPADLGVRVRTCSWVDADKVPDARRVSRNARLMLLVMTDTMNDGVGMYCDRMVSDHGASLIALLAPNYEVTDFNNWWPPNMDFLRNFKLFVDLRRPDAWAGKCDRELLPQARKKLNDWKGEMLKVTGGAVPCPVCVASATSLLHFGNYVSPERIQETMAAALAGEVSAESATVACPAQHELKLLDLVSTITQVEAIPCPACLSDRRHRQAPGSFLREECMAFFAEDNALKMGCLRCGTCRCMVRVLDVLVPQVFVSYAWGVRDAATGKYDVQERVVKLVKQIELATDMLCWQDISGGMGGGDDHMKAMRDGILKAKVVVLFLSERYVRSPNCITEFVHTVRSLKHVIPVLLEDWQGSAKQWWMHCRTIMRGAAREADRKALDAVDWSQFASSAPPLRMERSELSLRAVEQALTTRILSRLHRGH